MSSLVRPCASSVSVSTTRAPERSSRLALSTTPCEHHLGRAFRRPSCFLFARRDPGHFSTNNERSFKSDSRPRAPSTAGRRRKRVESSSDGWSRAHASIDLGWVIYRIVNRHVRPESRSRFGSIKTNTNEISTGECAFSPKIMIRIDTTSV